VTADDGRLAVPNEAGPRASAQEGRPDRPTGPAAHLIGLDWQLAGYGLLIGAVTAVATALLLHGPAYLTFLAAGFGAVIGAAAGYILGRPLKRDLRETTLYAALLARGRFEARLDGEGPGELRYLMRQLNDMAEAIGQQVDALRRLAEERSQLAPRAAQAAALEERQRLARELHDTVSQELFALAMMVGAARAQLPPDKDDVRRALQSAEEGARRAQATMRSLIRALRPVELGEQSLSLALEGLVDEARERYGVEARLEVHGATDLPSGIEDALFRIAQEAVSNALRHGKPKRLTVRLALHETACDLTVEDDGTGFDVQGVAAHFGLRSMRERAAEIGARLAVHSAPGQGCSVQVRLRNVTPPEKED
jgi:NarL family two-component system sensor histidine kinase LiaS